MEKRNFYYIMLLVLIVNSLIVGGCEEQKLYEYDYMAQQLAAKQLVGTWSLSHDIETPVGVSGSIFQTLSVVFGVEEKGNPGRFYSEGSDAAFVSAENSTWQWADATTTTKVLLNNVDPIAKITIDTSVKDKLTIAFVSDWHDTEGNEGKAGQFKVTLSRKK